MSKPDDGQHSQGAGTSPLPDGMVIERLALHAMATRFELVLCGTDREQLRALGEEAFHEIEECEQRWSLFRRDSFLSHINRTAASAWVRLNADDLKLFQVCQRVHRASAGAFDPSIAPLMRAHGFHGSDSGCELSAEIAVAEAARAVGGGSSALQGTSSSTAAAIEVARGRVGLSALQLNRERRALRFSRPDLHLDLGAIAKGHALDLAARVLRDEGVTAALLHGGTSTTIAIGAPPGSDAWCVAIGPDSDGGASAPRAYLNDCALAVSAPDGRVVEKDGQRLTHVLDPRTGMPADGPRIAAVIAKDALNADAWSTALLVGGSKLRLPQDMHSIIAEEMPAQEDSAQGMHWRALDNTRAAPIGTLPLSERPGRFLLGTNHTV